MNNMAQRYMANIRYAEEERDRKEEHTKWQGCDEHVTRFKDGSSIRHGAHVGDQCYDEFGKEC